MKMPHRLFILCAALIMFALGASWGTYFLWQLKFFSKFTLLDLFSINAHGQAQIYGWMGLMIMGVFYSHFKVHTQSLIYSLFFTVLGVVLNFIGTMSLDPIVYSSMGNGSIFLGVLIFFLDVFYRVLPKLENSSGKRFLFLSIFFYLSSTIYSFWHHLQTFFALEGPTLLEQVATYQAPLRDLQIHGVALFSIFAILYFVLDVIDSRFVKTSFILLVVSLLAEIFFYLGFRIFKNHLFAAFLPLAWMGLLTGCILFFLEARKFMEPKFKMLMKVAFSWLFISELMLILMPIYSLLAHVAFSHAYYGAIRHAITVGFVSCSLMAIVHQKLQSVNFLSVFYLLNLGCLTRVFFQILTDWHSIGFTFIALSGVIETLSIILWGLYIIKSPAETTIYGQNQ